MDSATCKAFKTLVFLFVLCCSTVLAARIGNPPVVENAQYWNEGAQRRLKAAVNMRANTNVAKNVIFFLGDGMGLPSVTAGRILKGQLKGMSGEEEDLTFDKFPHSALIKTYNVDRQTSDSAGTATAFLCGIKANAGTVGVDYRASRTNCAQQKGKEVDSILKWSLKEGKSVGIVTNTRLSHATPAASYAHSSERDWEGDADMDGVQGGCKDITDQLISDNKDIQVILGGGRRTFIPLTEPDPVTGTNDQDKNRRDGRNLIKEWIQDKENRSLNHKVLYNKTDVLNTDIQNVQYLLGLFATSHMPYELERDKSDSGQPSLAEMTELAIKVLRKNTKGYFLLVEGGRIDHAHHDSKGKRALHEVVAFDTTVETAFNMTNEKDTLIVVTADHSHVFVIGGYPSRGNDILGLTDYFGNQPDEPPSDNKPATTLLYGNGPGHNATHPRENLTGVDIHDIDYIQQSAVPMKWETHGAEDVAVYATGPMAHLFHGVQEQNYIAHVMAYASCVGENKDHCKAKPVPSGQNPLRLSLSVLELLGILVFLLV
ncbi:alkaline phosphatase-like [Liolophura sinensis]|uniref:alkaline phosphatase-like n=1 Tax=Liolophura sinensis TaxID=3198878 RepID=UPI0031580D32